MRNGVDSLEPNAIQYVVMFSTRPLIAAGFFLLGLLAGLSFKHQDSFIPFWLPTLFGGAVGGFVVLVAFGVADFLTSKARREERKNEVRCFDCNKTKEVNDFLRDLEESQPRLRCSCGSYNNSWNSLQKELMLGRSVDAGD